MRDLLLRREGKGKGGGKAKGEKCGRGKFCAVIIFQSENPEFIHVSVGTKTLVLDGSPGP